MLQFTVKKQLKPLNDITDKVGKLTGDFNKAAEKSGVSTGGDSTSSTETSSESTTTTTTTTDKSDSSTPITGTKTEKEIETESFYKQKLKDAETRRAEYIKTGETSKIPGVEEKIQFYKKKLGIEPNLKTTILVQDSDGTVQKLDSSQLKSKTDNTVSMLNNGSTSGSTTIVYQRQVVQTNVAVPV